MSWVEPRNHGNTLSRGVANITKKGNRLLSIVDSFNQFFSFLRLGFLVFCLWSSIFVCSDVVLFVWFPHFNVGFTVYYLRLPGWLCCVASCGWRVFDHPHRTRTRTKQLLTQILVWKEWRLEKCDTDLILSLKFSIQVLNKMWVCILCISGCWRTILRFSNWISDQL